MMTNLLKLLKMKSLWVGISLISVSLGSGFADNDWSKAGELGTKAFAEILGALAGAGIITLRLTLQKVIQALADGSDEKSPTKKG
jgi:hypothetical protein